MKVLFIVAIISIPFNCLATESYLCTITETIEAKFKHGKWINTNIIDGKGAYRIVVDGKKATVIEKIAERNNSYPIETSCSFVGGTAGYECKKFTKIIPYGEVYSINLHPSMNEITVDATYSLRKMDAYTAKLSGEYRKYFNDITLNIASSYGKCVKY